MTQAELHEIQLRRLALVFDEHGPAGQVAAKIMRDAADYIQQVSQTLEGLRND